MADTRYLKRRRQTWYFNIAVPADLRTKLGKPFITETLGTRDLTKAQRLRWAKKAQWTDAFERHRGTIQLTSAEIEDLAQRFFRAALVDLDRIAVAEALDASEEIAQLETQAGIIADEAERGDTASVARDIAEIATRTGAELVPATETYRRLGAALSAAKYHALRARAAALQGNQWPRPTTFGAVPGIDPVTLRPRRPAPAPRREGEGLRFSEAAERYIEEIQRDPAAKPTKQTLGQHKAVYRLFGQFVSDAALEDISDEKAAEFLAAVAKLHPHWGRSPETKKLTVWEVLERYGKGDKQLNNKTLNRYVSSLGSVFKWAKKRGHLAKASHNPFAEQSYEKPALAASRWLPYTVSELDKFMKAPLLVDMPATERIKPAHHRFKHALAWLPLLALFSGMRSNELCQLHTGDILKEGDVWFFRVHSDREDQRLKSEAAERRVPIHSTLIACGFLHYVKALPDGQLFPALKPGGPDGKLNWYLSKQFPSHRRGLGITRLRVSFHSFRKNAAQALKDARTTPSEIAELIGHERGFTVETYAPLGLPLSELKELVERIGYPRLQLSHLHIR